jgi:hypothetical protein
MLFEITTPKFIPMKFILIKTLSYLTTPPLSIQKISTPTKILIVGKTHIRLRRKIAQPNLPVTTTK